MATKFDALEYKTPGGWNLGTHFPFRMLGKEGQRYMACPYELADDDRVRLRAVDPYTARLILVDMSGTFQRDLLISQTAAPGLVVVTMTGYLYSGPVEVKAWKDDERYKRPEEEDREWRQIVRRLQMEQVEGFSTAVTRHRERTAGLDLLPQGLKDAKLVYEAMLYSVPRY